MIATASSSGNAYSEMCFSEGNGEPRMTTRTHRVPSFYFPDELSNYSKGQDKKPRSYSVMSFTDDSGAGSQFYKRR